MDERAAAEGKIVSSLAASMVSSATSTISSNFDLNTYYIVSKVLKCGTVLGWCESSCLFSWYRREKKRSSSRAPSAKGCGI